MDIIAIQGKGNSGKTKTLDLLNTIMEKDNDYNILETKKPVNKSGDFHVLFKHKKFNKKVAIYSEGDSDRSIKSALSIYGENKTDILVLACRTSGGTVKEINGAGSVSTIMYIGKSRVDTSLNLENDRDKLNKIDANSIKTCIDYLI